MRFLLLFLLCITRGVTFAQDYPTRAVRIIEPFGAGGGPDVIARAVSPKLSELWGQFNLQAGIEAVHVPPRPGTRSLM